MKFCVRNRARVKKPLVRDWWTGKCYGVFFQLFSPCLTATHCLLRTERQHSNGQHFHYCNHQQQHDQHHFATGPSPRVGFTTFLPSFRCCQFRLLAEMVRKMDFASVPWLQKLLPAAVSHSERGPGSCRCCDLQTCNCCPSPAGDLSGCQALCCQATWIETTHTLLW